ncbi:MAG: shikimate dehydrogenase, partial [Bacteroidia bacterium]|nr:shikimate dehydrogenase [Bacteroidia bacterium]
VMTYCQIWSPEAKLIGAVNCISLSASGELVGHNTDWIGFTQSISGLLQGKTVQRALVLGTGGSSKAVHFSLQRLGIEVSFASESKQEWSYSKLVGKMSQFQLVVQTTPLGMFPETNACPSIPYSELHEGHICVDLIYNPEQTLFLKEAAKQGATIKNGLDMLKYQAEESWRIWNSANEALI